MKAVVCEEDGAEEATHALREEERRGGAAPACRGRQSFTSPPSHPCHPCVARRTIGKTMSTVTGIEASSSTQYGAATVAALIACVGLYFFTSRLLRRRALQRCEQEAEAMRKAPREFTASE